GLDGRIGSKFFHAGVGYGGSCLPKDVVSFIHLAREVGYEPRIIDAVHSVNVRLVDRALEKLTRALDGLEGKSVGVLGLSFKPNTDDLREAPSLSIIEQLTSGGASVKVFDPIAMDNFKNVTNFDVDCCKNAYDCAEDCDAIVLVTEWNEFREFDFDRLKRLMRNHVFIDCRNVYKRERIESYGFVYDSFGRGGQTEE
ncbi:MAG: UDP-glucose/GDP-mannose dehydrogenase family protein, partial [Candidatus Krumholzibacteria bacterium]|nr:UDP-glucose/GDP-mannose dehydrogenase family protein [Candidatus Krumholzibacteria bacterium]